MKNIIIAGSINMDIVSTLDKYPEGGETVPGKTISYIPGGKGANQARAISRLGARVRLVGKIGKDNFGKTLIESLNKDGVSTKEIKISQNNHSGTSIIGVDKTGENRIIFVPGSNFDLTPKDLSHIKFQQGEFAISNFEIHKNTVTDFFTKAKKAGCITILNPSPIYKMPSDFLKLVDYLIINEHEFKFLSQSNDSQIESTLLLKTAKELFGKNQTLIVTFGSKGSAAIQGNNVTKKEAFKVNAVDTTGAGDSFLGAFSVALSEEKNINESLTFANAAAALKVTKLGASSMPFREEVEKFLRDRK